MMAIVPHVTSGLGLRKFQSDGFLLTRVYKSTFYMGILSVIGNGQDKKKCSVDNIKNA